MYIQWSTIPNLMIEVAGIMICIFALILIKKGMNKRDRSRELMIYAFSMMLVYNLCLLLLECTQFDPVPSPRALVFLFYFGTYVFPEIAAYYISLHIICIISKSEEEYQKGFLALRAFLIAEFILLLIVQFTGNLVYVDQAGRYPTGSAGFLGYAMVMIYMALDLILLLRYGSNITRSQKKAIITYLFLPIFSLIFKWVWPEIYFTALASCISMMIMLISLISEQSAILMRQERDNEQLKVDLMLSQIQPHFLFNVLYVIQEICLIDSEKASTAIGDFSRYLRHNMDSISINTPIPFMEELAHVKHYVFLQRLRFGDSLQIEYDLQCTDFSMPTLTLQPLVENAIRYGVRKSEDGKGTVTIRTREYPDYYKIHVIDDGPGFVVNTLPDDGMSHLGIKNVNDRLRRVCGGELIIDSRLGKGTDAVIIIPK